METNGNGDIKKSNNSFQNAVSLKEYIDAQLESRDKAVISALASNEKRLDGMNEFRDALKDQAGRFITRTEYETLMTKLNEEIDEIKDCISDIKSSISAIQTKLWIIISIGSVVIVWFIMHLIGKF
jgi:archaellum component FlaC